MQCISSDKIIYVHPPIESFLIEYNDLLASIYLKKSSKFFRYLASPTINRLEAQTHFFEKVQKYIQLRSMLLNDVSLLIKLIPEDYFLYEELSKEFKGRILICDNYILFEIKKPLKWLFLMMKFSSRVVSRLLKTMFVTIISIFIRPKTKYQSVIRTYFDHRCKDAEGKLREEYFGPLAFDLVKESKPLVVYKMIHERVAELWMYLKLRKSAKFDSCLLESFLSPLSVIKVFVLYLFSKIELKEKYLYSGMDITAILQQSLNDDYFSFRGLGVYVEYEVAKKVLGSNPERILMPYENQTWEKVYPLIKAKNPYISTKIIGFQHTGFSYKLLNHFPSKCEKSLSLFPDKIVTVGRMTKKILEEKAFYPCEIIEGAALRHTKLVKNGGFYIKSPRKILNNKIVYAFSYDISKYKKIIKALIKIFEGSSIIIYLKVHPDYCEDEVVKDLGIHLAPNFLLAQKIPWVEVYEVVDCVLYDDNSIGLEGIINGLKTFMLDVGEPIYDCNRMYYFNEWETTINMFGLLKLKQLIEEKRFVKEFDIEKVSEYVNSYYNAYSKSKYFSAYL